MEITKQDLAKLLENVRKDTIKKIIEIIEKELNK